MKFKTIWQVKDLHDYPIEQIFDTESEAKEEIEDYKICASRFPNQTYSIEPKIEVINEMD